MGPTDSNPLYWLSATLDPAGTQGGPLLATMSSSCLQGCAPVGDSCLEGAFTWPTMPDVLEAAGVSWKFYGTNTFAPYGSTPYFKSYANTPGNPMYAKGVAPTFDDFLNDAANGTLPAVSWVLTDFASSEHATNSPQAGMNRPRAGGRARRLPRAFLDAVAHAGARRGSEHRGGRLGHTLRGVALAAQRVTSLAAAHWPTPSPSAMRITAR